VKNGGHKSFKQFVDINDNQGKWDKKEVFFYPKLQLIEELFTNKPLVLFHDELKKDPYSFFDRIANYTGTTYNRGLINVNPQHKSYSEKQLKVIKKASRFLFPNDLKKTNSKTLHYMRFRSRWLLCHLILYSAQLFPNSWVPNETIINKQELEQVRNHFQEDWENCIWFARTKSFDPTVVDVLKEPNPA
jgi:hypothetical protein